MARFGSLRISYLPFANDVILLASSNDGLQLTVRWLRSETKLANTSKSEDMVFWQKKAACPLHVGNELLPKVKFKYREALFKNEERREQGNETCIGAASEVM